MSLRSLLYASLLLFAGALSVVSLTSCDIPREITEERAENASKDLIALRANNKRIPQGEFSLEEAVAYALEHNLDTAVASQEELIKLEARTGAQLKKLPSLMLNGERSKRNKYEATKSTQLGATEESAIASYSSDKNKNTFNASLAWSFVDFGVAYFRSRQAQNEAKIAAQKLRRARQNLAMQVADYYWRTQASKEILMRSRKVMKKIDARREAIAKQMKEKTINRQNALETEARLMETQARLRRNELAYQSNLAQLGALMGLPVGYRIELKQEKFELSPERIPDSKVMEEIALHNRPELYEKDMQEKISADEARVILMSMFPNASLFGRRERNPDKFVYYHNWYTVGLNASMDLLSLPQKFSRRRVAQMKEKLARKQRVALALGVITQVHLAEIEYTDAIEEYDFQKELDGKRKEILQELEKGAEEGMTDGQEVLDAEIQALTAYTQSLSTFARVMSAREKMRNTIGLDSGRDLLAMAQKVMKSKAPGVWPQDTSDKAVGLSCAGNGSLSDFEPEYEKAGHTAASGIIERRFRSLESLFEQEPELLTKPEKLLVAADRIDAEKDLVVRSEENIQNRKPVARESRKLSRRPVVVESVIDEVPGISVKSFDDDSEPGIGVGLPASRDLKLADEKRFGLPARSVVAGEAWRRTPERAVVEEARGIVEADDNAIDKLLTREPAAHKTDVGLARNLSANSAKAADIPSVSEKSFAAADESKTVKRRRVARDSVCASPEKRFAASDGVSRPVAGRIAKTSVDAPAVGKVIGANSDVLPREASPVAAPAFEKQTAIVRRAENAPEVEGRKLSSEKSVAVARQQIVASGEKRFAVEAGSLDAALPGRGSSKTVSVKTTTVRKAGAAGEVLPRADAAGVSGALRLARQEVLHARKVDEAPARQHKEFAREEKSVAREPAVDVSEEKRFVALVDSLSTTSARREAVPPLSESEFGTLPSASTGESDKNVLKRVDARSQEVRPARKRSALVKNVSEEPQDKGKVVLSDRVDSVDGESEGAQVWPRKVPYNGRGAGKLVSEGEGKKEPVDVIVNREGIAWPVKKEKKQGEWTGGEMVPVSPADFE